MIYNRGNPAVVIIGGTQLEAKCPPVPTQLPSLRMRGAQVCVGRVSP